MTPARAIAFPGWACAPVALAPLMKRLHLPGAPEYLPWTDALDGGDPQQFPEGAVLIGWSLGGMLAIRAALAHPGAVSALVLLATSARLVADGDYPGADARQIETMRRRLRRDPHRMLRDFFQRAAPPDTPDADVADAMAGVAAQAFTADQLDAGLARLADEDLRDQLAALRVPTLVVHDEGDAIIPVEQARRLAAAIPSATLQLTSGRGHLLPVVAPDIVADSVNTFLTGALQHG